MKYCINIFFLIIILSLINKPGFSTWHLAPPADTASIQKGLLNTYGEMDQVLYEALNCTVLIKPNIKIRNIQECHTPEWTFLSFTDLFLTKEKTKKLIVLDNTTLKEVHIPITDDALSLQERDEVHILWTDFHPGGFIISLTYGFQSYLFIYDIRSKKIKKFYITGPCRARRGKCFLSPDRSYFVFLPDVISDHCVFLDLELGSRGVQDHEPLTTPGKALDVVFSQDSKRFTIHTQQESPDDSIQESLITYQVRRSLSYLDVSEVSDHITEEPKKYHPFSTFVRDRKVSNDTFLPFLPCDLYYSTPDDKFIYTVTKDHTFLLFRKPYLSNPLLKEALHVTHPLMVLRFIKDLNRLGGIISDISYEEKHRLFLQYTKNFNHLVEEFHKVNKKIEDISRRIDEEEFWAENNSKVVYLMHIMGGKDSINLLKGFLGEDPYSLKRFFNELPIEEDCELTNALHSFYISLKKKDFGSFQNILKFPGAFVSLKKKEEFIRSIRKAAEEHISCSTLLKRISTKYLGFLADSLHIPSDNFDIRVMSRFHIPYLSRLKSAMSFIKNNCLHKHPLFKAILKSAFQNNFKNLITNVNQKDEIGRGIALHNKRNVRKAMRVCGIDPEAWLLFSKSKSFSHSERNLKIDPDDVILKMMGFIVKLHALLPDKNKKGLSNALKKLSLEVKGKNLHLLTPGLPHTKQTLTLILSQIDNIETLEHTIRYISRNVHDRNINELILHTLNTIENLKNLIQKPEIIKELSKKRRYFKIRMWKREPCHDLFLGDFTGCCLATNSNAHFDAMLDHLIDQGIQVAEVIDEDTGKTMALAWLFLAKDTSNNPYLVVDNIEVNKDYTFMKDKIKDELFNYTIQYAAHCGISTVLSGMFEFSEVDLDKEKYKIEMFNLKKIGGYYGGEKYYLEALAGKTLHIIKKDIKSKKIVTKTKITLTKPLDKSQ